jgi:type I restriction-modification system DNA methylase subunit
LQYAEREEFARIYWLFSREAVAGGSIETFAEGLPKPRGKAVQHGLFPGAYKPVDESLLEELDEYRKTLAQTFKNRNPSLDSETLTEITQRTLDRLVFLRFLEDKQIETPSVVDKFGSRGTAWEDFTTASRRLDGIYNGVVFKRHDILDAPTFRVDENAFADICERLSHINSSYNFDTIPIHILGSIYERFLGKVIVATRRRVRVEEKPEIRKAGGVYYTPEYVVRYIVENTVGKLIVDKTPDEIAEMRFGDIACGSGSFLLGVYDLLLQYHGNYCNANPEKAHKGDCIDREGRLYLSLHKKREILLRNIYGVDIDSQAVEVCQLSLYLRLLRDETTASAHQYLLEFEHAAQLKKLLPDLSKNIVCGNSLIGMDILEGQLFPSEEERKLNPLDFADAFPHIFRSSPSIATREPRRGVKSAREIRSSTPQQHPAATLGLDAIVGNPPYRMLQPHNTADDVLGYLRGHYVAAEFKIDLFHLFLQRAASLLRSGGYLGYIVPTTILNNVYAETLRGWLMDRCTIEQIAVARGRVFADADVHTCVLVLRTELSEKLRQENAVATTDRFAPDFAAKPVFASRIRQATLAGLPGRVWNILVNDSNAALISRLMTDFVPLEKTATINRGLITGDRRKYFAETRKSDQYVPILAGSDVHRYWTNPSSEFVLFKRPKSAGGCWDKEMHFAAHKLVVRQICDEPTASILLSPLAVTGNIFTVRSASIEAEMYLLGILNSRLTGFFWRIMFTDFKTSFPQVTIFSLAQVPVRSPDGLPPDQQAQHDQLIRLVEQMLETRRHLEEAKTDKARTYYQNRSANLDRQIDNLVYGLYALSEEEIRIVESGG